MHSSLEIFWLVPKGSSQIQQNINKKDILKCEENNFFHFFLDFFFRIIEMLFVFTKSGGGSSSSGDSVSGSLENNVEVHTKDTTESR